MGELALWLVVAAGLVVFVALVSALLLSLLVESSGDSNPATSHRRGARTSRAGGSAASR